MEKPSKTNKTVYLTAELLSEVERFRKEMGLTTFNSAVTMLLTKALRK